MEKDERTWIIITWVCLIIGFGLCAYLSRGEIREIFWFLCKKIHNHNADQHSIDTEEERGALAVGTLANYTSPCCPASSLEREGVMKIIMRTVALKAAIE